MVIVLPTRIVMVGYTRLEFGSVACQFEHSELIKIIRGGARSFHSVQWPRKNMRSLALRSDPMMMIMVIVN